MGDGGGEEDERPAHQVKISAFYMDRYEATQKAYTRLMGKNPAKFKGTEQPVERLSWLYATRFCNMRSLREGLQPCYDPDTLTCNYDASGYRLPTGVIIATGQVAVDHEEPLPQHGCRVQQNRNIAVEAP